MWRTDTFTALCFLAVPLIAAAAVERPLPRPLAAHPGNVYLAGEPVRIPLPANRPGAWELSSYRDASQVPVTFHQGAAELGALPAGFYRLRLAGDTNAEWISLAVLEPLKKPTPLSSPIAIDVAMAWFYRRDQMVAAASLCALAGVNWVRDRLSWPELEPGRGEFVPDTRYDDTARAQAAAHLRVLQVGHQSPGWANPEGKRFPLDLRDAYQFQREMAKRWRGKVLAFEPWNEADIDGFGGHTGSEMASLQKAAYLGMKAANPGVLCCLNVFATHRKAQLEDLRANQAWPYFDTYNLHHYEPYERYPGLYADHRAVSAGKPLWVTECAQPVKWSGDNERKELADEQLWEQSERLVKTFAASLHEGSATTFYFMLPHYVEGQTQFGILRPDLTPRPAYVALAAVGRLLADARPLGRLRGQSNLVGYLFSTQTDGRKTELLVAWAKTGQASLQVNARAAWDHLGRSLAIPATAQELTSAPRYFALKDRSGLGLDSPPSAPRKLAGRASPVVFQVLVPRDRAVLAKSACRISTEQPAQVILYAYNFSGKTVRGTAALSGNTRFLASQTATGFPRQLELAPMERKELVLKLDCRNARMGVVETLKVTGDFGAAGKPVLSFNLMPDPLRLDTLALLALDAAGDPSRWSKEISGPGACQVAATNGGVEVLAEPQGPDRWAYPRLDLIVGERAPKGATGLAFQLTLLEGSGQFRVIWREEGGAGYVSDLLAGPNPGQTIEAVAAFEGAAFGTGWSPPDPNNKLDPGLVNAVKIGLNTKDARVKYVIRNARWISF